VHGRTTQTRHHQLSRQAFRRQNEMEHDETSEAWRIMKKRKLMNIEAQKISYQTCKSSRGDGSKIKQTVVVDYMATEYRCSGRPSGSAHHGFLRCQDVYVGHVDSTEGCGRLLLEPGAAGLWSAWKPAL